MSDCREFLGLLGLKYSYRLPRYENTPFLFFKEKAGSNSSIFKIQCNCIVLNFNQIKS